MEIAETQPNPYDNPLFPSLKSLAAKEIVTSCGNLIFENEQGELQKYEFKDLPSVIKIQLFEALINKDGYTQKTDDSSLFKRWIQKENWPDENYHFSNVPIKFSSSSRYFNRNRLYQLDTEIIIDPYNKHTNKFYPNNSTRETNYTLYYKGSYVYEICELKNSPLSLKLAKQNSFMLKIKNLNDENELLSIINQLQKIGINNIIKITIENSPIDKDILDQIIELLDLEKFQLLEYTDSENKSISYYKNEDY